MRKIKLLFTVLIIPLFLSAQEGLSLEQCKRLAVEHNRNLRIAREGLGAADAAKKSAFTKYLPDFSANGIYKYINKDFQLLEDDIFLPVVPYTAIDPVTGTLNEAAFANPSVAASTFVINPATGTVVTDGSGNPVFQNYSFLPASETTIPIDNLFMANVGFTQPVYLGGKIREANRIASLMKDVAESNLDLTEDEIIFSVEEAYWRIVSLDQKVILAEEYREMLNHLVADLQNIYSEGIITDNDLLKAKLKLSEAEIQCLKARNGMELSKMLLCQITGVEYSRNLFLTDTLNASDPWDIACSVNESEISARPELAILESNVAMANSEVKLMKSRYLPNIVLNAGYSFMNPDPYSGLVKEFASDYSIGLACNIPIYHFGDKRHTLNAAKHSREIARLKLEDAKEMMLLQLQQAVYTCSESLSTTEYAEQALVQARENLEFTEDNFKEGTLKTADLLEAQVLWQKAYSELIDARTEQQMAVSNLKKVRGNY